jgi:hypothetical protein
MNAQLNFLKTKLQSNQAILFCLILFVMLIQKQANATSYTSIATGDWATSTTWSPNGVPGAGDDVIIQGGYTVTLTSNQSCGSIIIGNTGSGTLSLGIRTLTIVGNMTVSNSSSGNITGTNSNAKLNIGGDLIFNATGSIGTFVGLILNGSNSAQTIQGSKTTLSIFSLKIDNTNGVVSNINITITNLLTLTNGTFDVNGKTLLFEIASLAIARSNGNLDLDNGKLSIMNSVSQNFTLDYFSSVYVKSFELSNNSAVVSLPAITITGDLRHSSAVASLTFSGTTLRGTWINSAFAKIASSSNLILKNNFSVPASIFIGSTLTGKLTLDSTIANLTITGSTLTLGDLDLNSGSISGTNISIGSGKTITRTNGSFSSAPSFAGIVNLTYNESTSPITMSYEVPSSGSVNNLIINNSQGVSMASNIQVAGTLSLSNGNLNIGSNTLTYDGTNSISRTAGNLNGTSSSNLVLNNTTATTLFMNGSPANLNNLTINNSNGVTLGQSTTIAGSLTLTSGNLNIGSNTLTLNGAVSRTSGYLSGTSSSNLTLGGSNQTIYFNPSGNTIKNFSVSTFGSINLGSNLNITGGNSPGLVSVATFASLNSNGYLTLKSDVNGTAYMALATNSTLTGNVNIEQYIPAGYRKHRILAHPFSSAINLSQLTDDIDITGNTTGGISNSSKTKGTGFDSTYTNNPSAFWFNPANANGASIDGGWTAFTAADGSGSNNTWNPARAIRLLIRGAKGQGLDGNTYTPNNVTLTMSGQLNAGNFNFGLVTGGSGNTAGYNLVGNPYASPVDISAVIFAANNHSDIDKTIYTRNPQTGAWVSQLLVNGTPYYIPAYTGAFIKVISIVSLPFSLARTGTSSAITTFKQNNFPMGLQLKCYIDNAEYDNLYVLFNDSAKADFVLIEDANKLMNDSINFYSVTADGKAVCNNVLPLTGTEIIPLYIGISRGKNTLQFKVENSNIPQGYQVYLVDKYTNKRVLIQFDAKYEFTVDANIPSSIGSNRFYLEVVKMTNGIPLANKEERIVIYPNPCSEVLRIQSNKNISEPVQIAIIDPLGHEVMQGYWFNPSKGDYRMDIKDLGNGVYTILIKGEHVRHSQLFIKAE